MWRVRTSEVDMLGFGTARSVREVRWKSSEEMVDERRELKEERSGKEERRLVMFTASIGGGAGERRRSK